MKKRILLWAVVLLALSLAQLQLVFGWSNGGYSTDAGRPVYGTHDFLAHHALDFVPDDMDFWVRSNLQLYLYGTELPDNKNAPLHDGIGDSMLHHLYYHANGQLQDDAAARRAEDAYQQTLRYLSDGNISSAAKWMGITSHYVDDLAVFGHVMGSTTDWGSERHHSDYENWVNANTNRYDAQFKTCLSFEGRLNQTSAYGAALRLAHDTTFDDSGRGRSARWMDENYNLSNQPFKARVCESINHAVNHVAELILNAAKAANIPEFSSDTMLPIVLSIVFTLIITERLHCNKFRCRRSVLGVERLKHRCPF